MRHAKCDWIFWMDADDRLDGVNREMFQRLKAQLPDGNYAYMMKQWSPSDASHGSPLVVDHVRLFRRQAGIEWRYRLHEQILLSLKEKQAKLVVTDIVIQHLGYQERALKRQKLERNLRILFKEQQERPQDAFVLFNLAGTYIDIGEREKATPLLRECIEKAPRGASFLPKAHVMLVRIHSMADRIQEALADCQNARRCFPKDAELCFEEGLIHQAQNDLEVARQAFETILRLPRGPQLVGTDAGIYDHLARHHLALMLRELKRFLEAEQQWRVTIAHAPHFVPAWLGLSELLIVQNRSNEIEGLIMQAQDNPRGAPIASTLRARLQLAQKNVSGACETLEQAVATNAGSVWLRLFLCDVYMRHGINLDKAESHLRHIATVDPYNQQAQTQLTSLAKRRARP